MKARHSLRSLFHLPGAGRLPILILAGILSSPLAWAGDDCEVPLERWQSRSAVRQMALDRGWTLQRLKIDDGCYEIRATDAQGRHFKAKLDPETLQVIKLKHKDRQQRRERIRSQGPDTGSAATGQPPATGNSPSGRTD